MPDTVSIIRLEGEPLSVEAEKKRHSEWVKQEAQLLMDELFIDLHQPVDFPSVNPSDATDVDWVEGHILTSSSQSSDTDLGLVQGWQSLELDEPRDSEDERFWVAPSKTTPFYQRMLLILGGLAIVTPLSVWGGSVLQAASQSKSVIAATSIQSLATPTPSDQEFANYAEKALQQIEAKPQSVAKAVGITTLPTLTIGNIPSAIPPVVSPQAPVSEEKSNQQYPVATPAAPKPKVASTPPPSAKDINRLALRVFQPEPIQSAVPPLSGSESVSDVEVAPGQSLPEPPNLSNIAPAPASSLPALSPNIAEPAATIASATPMNSPANASKKVIGIVELGLQSTLMVSNNGSHLNFQVGDTVNDEGWKLVQIAEGKAILQKGTEYKSLSEGQQF